jgi:hypothetical protein
MWREKPNKIKETLRLGLYRSLGLFIQLRQRIGTTVECRPSAPKRRARSKLRSRFVFLESYPEVLEARSPDSSSKGNLPSGARA